MILGEMMGCALILFLFLLLVVFPAVGVEMFNSGMSSLACYKKEVAGKVFHGISSRK